MMQPVLIDVELRILESAREPTSTRLEVLELPVATRVGRVMVRGGAVLLAGAVLAVVPLIHLCGAAVLLLATPVTAWWTWRHSVRTARDQYVACPKCQAAVKLEARSMGWPLQVSCQNCSGRISAGPINAGPTKEAV